MVLSWVFVVYSLRCFDFVVHCFEWFQTDFRVGIFGINISFF